MDPLFIEYVPSNWPVPAITVDKVMCLCVQQWAEQNHVRHECNLVSDCGHHIVSQAGALLGVGNLQPAAWLPSSSQDVPAQFPNLRLGIEFPVRELGLGHELAPPVPVLDAGPSGLQD